MIAWLVGIITLILLVFILWRVCSSTFRERAERPKFRFLENLGIRAPKDNHATQTHRSKEDTHEKRNS